MGADPPAFPGESPSSASIKSPATQLAVFGPSFENSGTSDLVSRMKRMDHDSPGPYSDNASTSTGYGLGPYRKLQHKDYENFMSGRAIGSVFTDLPKANYGLSHRLNPLQRHSSADSALPTRSRYSDLGLQPNRSTDYSVHSNKPLTSVHQGQSDLRSFNATNSNPGHGNGMNKPGDQNLPAQWSEPSELALFRGNRSTYPGPTGHVSAFENLSSQKDIRPYDRRNGQFWMGFSDMREGQQAIKHLARGNPAWAIEPVGETNFKNYARIGFSHPVFEDQVLVIAFCGPGRRVPHHELMPTLKDVLELVGPIADIRPVKFETVNKTPRFFIHGFVARYYDSTHASNAVRAINAISTPGFILEILGYHRDMETHKIRHWNCQEQGAGRMIDPDLSPEDSRDQSPRTPSRHSINDERAIDLQAIIQGKDNRCTVMLKNIPNSQTWDQLKTYLDVTSAKKFDFLYLRMDFEQRLNVGYAFINFASFFSKRNGTPWPAFGAVGRMKYAHVSYATAQGYNFLVEKFRNSPVMLDFPDNRPKLFYIHGPRTGEEAPFPPVNNFWTLAKGVDRSKLTGLYKGPRENRTSGNGHHDADRRHGSDDSRPGSDDQRRGSNATPRRQSDSSQPGTVIETPTQGLRRHTRGNSKWEFPGF
ncbi:Meiosis protein MEI2 [Penicillium verhagenii]|uniref:Meiosis protein MEI2 n=1 Tax=Penicillium verhagenii TaxID=1562060 RepID=UPI00254590CB|nr:Meiosis protein MEI2 [Penicillium verhagenii]KAJ5921556.1 Meiosis protein MEI2 [Penicillium verhagenii]